MNRFPLGPEALLIRPCAWVWKRSIAPAWTVVLLLAALPAQATEQCGNLPFKSLQKTLDNGLRIIVVDTDIPNVVSLQISVQVGVRNEVEEGKSGYAHLIERMMFRGTTNDPSRRYQSIMNRMGARQSAYTSDDFTNFGTTFPEEHLATVLEMEADRFQNLTWSADDQASLARTLLNEHGRASANPVSRIFETQRDRAFRVHPYKGSMVGLRQDVEQMPQQYEFAKSFFQQWYRPESTTLVVAGNVDPQRTLALVETHWSAWRRGAATLTVPKEPEARGPITAHIPWTARTLPWITIGFRSPSFSATEKDFAALQMLFDVLFGPTSDLYRRLVDEEEKVDRFGADLGSNIDPSLATMYARLRSVREMPYVRDEILRTIAEARTSMVPEARLTSVKTNGRYALLRALDNSEAIAGAVIRYARFDRRYETLDEFSCTQASLTSDDLRVAARTYFQDANMIVTTLSREPLPAEMSRLPAIAEMAEKPDSARVPGGEIDLLLARSSLDQLDIKFQFRVGSARDPIGKEGLARLAASLLADGGSSSMTLDAVEEALFPIAGSFSAQVDKEVTTFTGRMHRDHWSRFIDVVLPILLDPGLRLDDFKQLKRDQLNELQALLGDDETMAAELLEQRVFKGAPYGHAVLGTIEGIESITLKDVKRFISSYYTTGNLIVGIAGDVPDALPARLKRELTRLPGATTPRPSISIRREPLAIKVDLIAKPAGASTIALGLPIDVTRAHSDFAALSVARACLGEPRVLRSRLNDRLRDARGLTAGASASIEASPDPGALRQKQIFQIVIRSVAPENNHMTLRVAIHELRSMIENGISEPDFQTTRDYLMNNAYMITASQDRELGHALDAKWYGTPDYTNWLRERLRKLTRDDVNRAIRKHLLPADLFAVVITPDAQLLRERLLADAKSPVLYALEKPRELLEEDKVIEVMPLAIESGDLRLIPLADVFADRTSTP